MTARPSGDRSRALRSRGTSVGANGRRGSSSQPCENLLRVFTASAAAPRRRPSILLSSLLVCGGRSVFGSRRRFFLSVGGGLGTYFRGRAVKFAVGRFCWLGSILIMWLIRCGAVRYGGRWLGLTGTPGRFPGWLTSLVSGKVL